MARVKQVAMLTQAGKKKMEELHKKMLMHKKNKGKDEHDGAVATKRKWRSGTVAVREIRRLSKTTNSLMNKMPFKRLVRDILNKCNGDARISKQAMNALHEGTESYLLELFIKSDIMREHRGCETLMKKDMSIAKYMDHKCINVRRDENLRKLALSAASEKKASKAAEKSSSTPLSLAKLVKKNSKVVPLPEASKKKSPHANGSKAASGVVKKVAKKDANTVQLDNMLEDELDGGMDQEEEEEEVDNTEEEGDASAVM